MSITQAVTAWYDAGVSVIPIAPNGTKRPAVRWATFQMTLATRAQVDQWWGNGGDFGLALICGAVSGQLEMLELEARASDSGSFDKIQEAVEAAGISSLWDLLNGPEGYVECSPSGGLHYLYRIVDHPVPGNTKIAQDRELKVLVETRGEGGYVIAAPTSGRCHPTGEPWRLVYGAYGRLPKISWEQRLTLHAALASALDCSSTPGAVDVPATAVLVPPRESGLARGLGVPISPGDDFEARVDFADIIEPHGWQLHHRRGLERHWTRPGKNVHDGTSATTGHDAGRERLYVFSTSTVFKPETSYTKFGAFALLNFNGDHSEAARELVRLGYGVRADPADGILPPPRRPPSTEIVRQPESYSFDDVGNAKRLWAAVKGKCLYVSEERLNFSWNGVVWDQDHDGALWRAAIWCTENMAREAIDTNSETLLKWAKSSRNKSRLAAATELYAKLPGATKRISEFDPHPHLINLHNGVFNLVTFELTPHDPGFLMTKLLAASYEPEADCPNFQQFMYEVLPDLEMRTYIQRALGYSLLGEVDQRALFLVYGPTGTGKSTLLETMRAVFGDYGITAAAGTFRARNREGATNDLHDLRGRRFVTASETTEHATYDEEVLKRLTGRDRVRTRELYQSNQEWVPQCVLWIATNHPPRFSADDDAVWRRAKLVPFTNQFLGAREVPDLARTRLVPEADGIFNWLLDGLKAYRVQGLDEPQEVREAAQEQRRLADSVARFLDERLGDGLLVEEPGATIKVGDLHLLYLEWARACGERPLGARRFTQRVPAAYPQWEQLRYNGQMFWKGIRRTGPALRQILPT